MISPRRPSSLPRAVAVSAPHGPFSAARAAATARSTSADPPSGTRAQGRPVKGSTLSYVEPDAADDDSPPISRSNSTSCSIAVPVIAPSSSRSGLLLVVQRVRAGSGVAKVSEELAVSGGDTGGQIAGLPHRANCALNTIRSARGDFSGQFQSTDA